MNMFRVMVVMGTAPAFSANGFGFVDARWASVAPLRAFEAAIDSPGYDSLAGGVVGVDVERGLVRDMAPLAAARDLGPCVDTGDVV